MTTTSTDRPTRSTYCPTHPDQRTRTCSACAGDHKAGEHAEVPSTTCRFCKPPPPPRPRTHKQPTLDVAALAAHDDTLIPRRPHP